MAWDVEKTAGWAQWRARRLQALAITVGYCGLRRNEAIYLRASDVHLEERYIALVERGRALKTVAAAQCVPIPEAALPILTSWAEHRLDHPGDFPIPEECPWWIPNMNRRGCWSGGSPGTKAIDRLQQVAERAGAPGMTWQSLRASWATRAEASGMSALTIQRVLRHTTPLTGQWYRANDLRAIQQATAGFDY
jgi:integrase